VSLQYQKEKPATKKKTPNTNKMAPITGQRNYESSRNVTKRNEKESVSKWPTAII